MKSYEVAHVSDIEPKGARTVRIGNLEIALFKLSSGEIHAVENRCPHKNGKLSEGMVCEHYVYCPLHDWKIDVTDGRVQDPDEGCVRRFPVEIDPESGKVILRVDEEELNRSA